MSEWSLVWIVPARIGILAVFCTFYVIGGRSGGRKFIRRFIGGIFLAVSLILLALLDGLFRWPLLFLLAAYPATLCMGYGGDSFWVKVFRRAAYGLALGGCALIISVVTGNWFLGGFQVALAAIASVLLGIKNTIPAVHEEASIALLGTCLTVFMV